MTGLCCIAIRQVDAKVETQLVVLKIDPERGLQKMSYEIGVDGARQRRAIRAEHVDLVDEDKVLVAKRVCTHDQGTATTRVVDITSIRISAKHDTSLEVLTPG